MTKNIYYQPVDNLKQSFFTTLWSFWGSSKSQIFPNYEHPKSQARYKLFYKNSERCQIFRTRNYKPDTIWSLKISNDRNHLWSMCSRQITQSFSPTPCAFWGSSKIHILPNYDHQKFQARYDLICKTFETWQFLKIFNTRNSNLDTTWSSKISIDQNH